MLANDLNRNSNIGLVVGATAINELMNYKKSCSRFAYAHSWYRCARRRFKGKCYSRNESSSALVNVSRDISFSGKMDSNSIYKSAENYFTLINRYLND